MPEVSMHGKGMSAARQNRERGLFVEATDFS